MTTQTIDPQQLDPWSTVLPGNGPQFGNAIFVNGPGTPPLGSGSLQLTLPVGADINDVAGLRYENSLSGLTSLSYETYVTTGDANDAPYLALVVSHRFTADDIFIFEP